MTLATIKLTAAVLLGSAALALPAQAISETTAPAPSVTAENAGLYEHHWNPSSVGVGAGASVQFSNPTAVPHGIRWIATPGGANPACAAGVPVAGGTSSSGTGWSGSCTFTAAGTYTYYCTVHGAAMSGTIVVGGPPTTPAPPPTLPPSYPEPTPGPSPGPAPAPGSPGAPHTSALSALRVHQGDHGSAVRGSLDVSAAGGGERLEVELLAASAALAARSAATARVGLLVRSHVAAGTVAFTVGLDRRARSALRRRGHLVVTVRTLLGPAGGGPAALARRLSLSR